MKTALERLGSLQETHACLLSLAGLNFNFSVCPQASRLPQSHLLASALSASDS